MKTDPAGKVSVGQQEDVARGKRDWSGATIQSSSIRTSDAPPAGLVHINPTILVVDDDGALLHAMQGLLERCGYQVLSARDVPEARAAIDVRIPDLVVMDLVLPGMDGRTGARILSEQCPGLRILFISGYANDESMRMARMGANEGFLAKPFSAEELLGAIERILEGREWDEASGA